MLIIPVFSGNVSLIAVHWAHVSCYICCLCLWLFPACCDLLKALSKTKTTSADMADCTIGQAEVHVSTDALITQLSSLPFDLTGLSLSLRGLYVSFHCLCFSSSPGQGTAPQKTQSVIKTKGQRRPTQVSMFRLKLVRRRMTSAKLSTTSCTPVEMHRDTQKKRGTFIVWHLILGVVMILLCCLWQAPPPFQHMGGLRTW